MAGISPEALAGYILEELLAYLLRNAGYRLLTDESQDPRELANRHHGLVVRGRGADHQVDVLGELLWVPAFTFPLRLALEAKCRKSKTDIATVRNLVAALIDINQNNMPNRRTPEASVLHPKYTYVGAIFSASGFSSHAADFALAHAVSLIDLRAPDFQPLVDAARRCGTTLNANYTEQQQRSAQRFVRAIRDRLREALQTGRPIHGVASMPDVPENWLNPAINAARHAEELFIGMAAGPYMLVLKADNPERFLEYAREHPNHAVRIRWSPQIDEGHTWSIVPINDANAYRLSFKLPERLATWIFTAQNVRRAATTAKELFFASITIYRRAADGDQLIRLNYDPPPTDV